ncbi:DegT/DnrJ/EryC1/StrS family aminotransferase [Catellatospora sp. NPDC049609]|uniref:DegT/DnrJ/EryC1/StrS family aminotransferase n=1 Tax=Catellatospora sp. NPDC049609 TaxID=3155505 RepID=UPI003417E771
MTTTETRYDTANPVDDRYAPPLTGEIEALRAVLEDGRLSGGAVNLPVYETALADYFGVRRALAVSSGTTAIDAALVAMGVGPGAEVLVPATAVGPTAMPILTRGATPVIVDTQPGSLALDPADVERKISRRTKAALVLPLWGYPNDERAAAAVLQQAGVPIVEDACQAHGTRIGGRHAGTIGRVGALSTHDRKLVATGEGGFLLTDDEELADRIDHYTHLGHLKSAVHGTNFKLGGLAAAVGLVRLGQLPRQLARRAANARRILDALPLDGLLRELVYGEDDTPNYYSLVLIAHARQAEIGAALASAGLPPDSIRWGYRPLYHRPLFSAYATACPNAEAFAASTFQLPVHPGLDDATLEWMAGQVAAIARGGNRS